LISSSIFSAAFQFGVETDVTGEIERVPARMALLKALERLLRQVDSAALGIELHSEKMPRTAKMVERPRATNRIHTRRFMESS